MYPDFKELLSALNAHSVKYLVVGGYAVAQHALPRATKDLDILIQPAPKNAAALIRALNDFGAPTADITVADFAERRFVFRFGVPPIAIAILPEIPGLAFNSAWKNRITVVVDATTGLTGHFISRDDLIAAKLAAGRPQDLADVEALRQAAEAMSSAAQQAHKVKDKKKPAPKT